MHFQFGVPMDAGLLQNLATNDSHVLYSSMLGLSIGKQFPKCLGLFWCLAMGNNLGNSNAIHILPIERGILKSRNM